MAEARAQQENRPALSDALKTEWSAARDAYWRRDMEKAASLYAALAAAHPDQADVLGEMGNVYLAVGNRDKAAEAYLAAGEALVKANRSHEAGKALMALGQLDRQKADALQKTIREAAKAAK